MYRFVAGSGASGDGPGVWDAIVSALGRADALELGEFAELRWVTDAGCEHLRHAEVKSKDGRTLGMVCELW